MTGPDLAKTAASLLARKGAWQITSQPGLIFAVYRSQPLVLHIGEHQPTRRQASELTQARQAGSTAARIGTLDQLHQLLDRIDHQKEAA